jgi:hypothetical protein
MPRQSNISADEKSAWFLQVNTLLGASSSRNIEKGSSSLEFSTAQADGQRLIFDVTLSDPWAL